MIVGIDIGTQSLKAVVVDDALTIRGEGSAGYAPSFPHPGRAEQDPARWEESLGPAIARALDAAGARPSDVAALGVCGQLDGSVAVDARGHALAPCIIWMDRRAEAETADVPAALVRERCGVVLDATHMAAKIRWQKRHLTDAGRAACFHQPVSYVVARLTGERVFDHGLASTTMLYNLERRAFDAELLDRFEIRATELPAIAEAEAVAGALGASGATLTGLPAGIPVAVGTGDDFSNPLGAGVVKPGRAVCTLGTAEVVGAVHDAATIDPGALVETHGFAGGRFFVENPGWLSGGAVEWLADVCGVGNAAALDALAGPVPPGSNGLIFLPALSGAMAPEWIAAARGCYYGLTPAHRTGALARALLEGCAFAMRDVLERLADLGVRFDSVVLLGGGARSDVWARIRADAVGLPIDRPAVTDTSPLGAALLAAVASGGHADLESAAACISGEFERIEPDGSARAAYDGAFQRYRRLFESLRPMFVEAGG